jgi:basic amino acid/polyamine antiporter, APA family
VTLALATCVGLLLVAVTGLTGAPAAVPAAEAAPAGFPPAFGLAMVFVLLAYGGWNEAAYVSADVSRRNMVRALLWGIGTITAIYLLVNFAYVRVLGMAGMAASTAIAADLVERASGPELAAFTSGIIAIAALSTMNATTLTGGRSNLALGRDVPLFRALGQYDAARSTPRNALLVQGAITLLLVVLGAVTRTGFAAIVEYTAPVFWLFFFLVGVSVFVLRHRDSSQPRPFRVPFYPLTPLIFCGMCLYMIRSSLAYTGMGALVGVGVLLAGLPLLLLARNRVAPVPVLKEEEVRL